MRPRAQETQRGRWDRLADFNLHTFALASTMRAVPPCLVQSDGSDLYWALSSHQLM